MSVNLNYISFSDEITIDSGRHYYLNEKKYPSVTTLLSKYEDKSFLSQWRDRIGHHEANLVTSNSATRGTQTHALIEKYLKDRILPTRSKSDEISKYATSAIKDFYAYIDTLGIEEGVMYEDDIVQVVLSL